MTITKEAFNSYAKDVLGYDDIQVKEIFQQIRDFGTPLEDYLTQEQLVECYEFSNKYVYPLPQ